MMKIFKKNLNKPELNISIPEMAYEKVDNQLERVCLRIIGESPSGTFIGVVVLFLNGEPISVIYKKNLIVPDTWENTLKTFAKKHLHSLRHTRAY